MLLLHFSFWLVLLISLYLTIRKISTWLSYKRKMLAHNCSQPRHYHHADPFTGYDLYRKTVKGKAEGRQMRVLQDLHHRYGKTFQAKFLGVNVIYTSDPQNI